jgi:hypothetical protein
VYVTSSGWQEVIVVQPEDRTSLQIDLKITSRKLNGPLLAQYLHNILLRGR